MIKILLPCCLLFAGCVSQKKYNELLDSKARTDREVMRLNQVEDECEELKSQYNSTLNSLTNTEEVLQDLQTNLSNLENEHGNLQVKYDELLGNNIKLQETCAEEKEDLTALLALRQTELDDKERILRSMEATLYANEDALRARDQRVRELNAQLLREQERLDSLKNSISEALLGFSAEDLTVVQRDGKVYVSLSQNLLFEKNSKEIDAAGRDALGKLALVLNEAPDIDITVEGHTDTDGDAAYNWDLSVSRATAVVKALMRNGLPGDRITAAGRAFYDPIDPGDDETAKSRNRRTEIILSPKLDRVMQILNP